MRNYKVLSGFVFNEHSQKASRKIKIGNLEYDLIFKMSTEDLPLIELPSEINTLINAGMKLDFSDLKDEYAKALPKRKELMEELKRAEFRERYPKTWPQRLGDLPEIGGVEYDFEDIEDYVNRMSKATWEHTKGPTVRYKGYSVSISYDQTTDYSSSYYYRGTGNWKYYVNHKITDYKKRGYKKIETAIKKIVELIDQRILDEARQKIEDQKELDRKNEKYNRFTAEFSGIVRDKKWVSYGYRRSSGPNGYSRDMYYIVVGSQKLTIEDSIEGLYTLNGIKELSAESVREIIKVIIMNNDEKLEPVHE